MKLLNKSKLSVYPDEILVSELIHGDIAEYSDFYNKQYLQRMTIYSLDKSSVSSYYSINDGEVLLPENSTLLCLVNDIDDIHIKEISIDELKPNMYICDSSLISEFDDRKKELLEIGITAEAVEIYKIVNGLDDSFVLPIPFFVYNIEIINETEECTDVIFGVEESADSKSGFVFIDSVAVKVY